MQTTWMRRGTVSGRVALLLRSAEIQPPSHDLFDWFLQQGIQSPLLFSLPAGGYRVALPKAAWEPNSTAASVHFGSFLTWQAAHVLLEAAA